MVGVSLGPFVRRAPAETLLYRRSAIVRQRCGRTAVDPLQRSSVSRRLALLSAAVALVIAVAVIAFWPAETRVAVDYQPTVQRIHFYEKALHFLSRDRQTRRQVEQIVTAAASDEANLLRIFEWVRENVRDVPAGFPIVDDHPFHIIVRGYGAADQQSEAFSLLASYAGFRAATMLVPSTAYPLATVELEDRQYVFDVPRGLAFVDGSGRLIDLETLLADRNRLRQALGDADLDPNAYHATLAEFARLAVNTDRMEMQKPLGRLWYELTHLPQRVLTR